MVIDDDDDVGGRVVVVVTVKKMLSKDMFLHSRALVGVTKICMYICVCIRATGIVCISISERVHSTEAFFFF